MTNEEKNEMKKLVSEHIQEKSKELEAKMPKLTWLWRIISILALAMGMYSLTSCTMTQSSTQGDGAVKTTTISFDPDNTVKYIIPVVHGGK